jgi:hypothetical protein
MLLQVSAFRQIRLDDIQYYIYSNEQRRTTQGKITKEDPDLLEYKYEWEEVCVISVDFMLKVRFHEISAQESNDFIRHFVELDNEHSRNIKAIKVLFLSFRGPVISDRLGCCIICKAI